MRRRRDADQFIPGSRRPYSIHPAPRWHACAAPTRRRIVHLSSTCHLRSSKTLNAISLYRCLRFWLPRHICTSAGQQVDSIDSPLAVPCPSISHLSLPVTMFIYPNTVRSPQRRHDVQYRLSTINVKPTVDYRLPAIGCDHAAIQCINSITASLYH